MKSKDILARMIMTFRYFYLAFFNSDLLVLVGGNSQNSFIYYWVDITEEINGYSCVIGMSTMSEDPAARQATTLKELEICGAIVLQRSGPYTRLGCAAQLNPGITVQWQGDGEVLQGEVLSCAPCGAQFEIWVETRQRIAQEASLQPAWRSDAPASVMGDLLKLNAQLLAHEPFRQSRAGEDPEDRGDQSRK